MTITERKRNAGASVVSIVIAILVIVVLAIIAIPAYQDYTVGISQPRPHSDKASDEKPGSANPVIEDIVVTGSGARSEPPFWNVWIEESRAQVEPTFNALSEIDPESSYDFIFDLSMLPYDFEEVTTRSTSQDVTIALESANQALSFDFILIADAKGIEFSSESTYVKSQFTVDIAKYRRLKTEMDGNENIEATLAAIESSIGRVLIPFRTKNVTGWIPLSLSIWSNGIPVDEIPMYVCVKSPHDATAGASANECDEDKPQIQYFSGIDSYRAANSRYGSARPDAAFHFVDISESNVVGIFRCNSCGWPDNKFLTWNLGRNADELSEYLEETIQVDFENAATIDDFDNFEAAGRALFRTLTQSVDSQNVWDLRRQISDSLSQITSKSPTVTPSVFVRLIGAVGASSFEIALGLLRIEDGDSKYFLAERFRIESPLTSQNYAVGDKCIDSWVALVPPSTIEDVDIALSDARRQLTELIIGLKRWTGHSTVYENIPAFRLWLELGYSDEGNDERPSTDAVVMILSHHEKNRLFFDSKNKSPSITSSAVDRFFGSNSLAIINACGAASPGASDFLEQFNYYGVPAVIATNMTVNAVMAGDFMLLFSAFLRKNEANPKYAIGQAVFDATNDLSKTYGPEAYIYSVRGNSALRVCVPPT